MTGLIHHTHHHAESGTLTHVFACERTGDCVVIDPVLDYDQGEVHTETVDDLIVEIHSQGWRLLYVLETHAHADHLTAAQVLKSQLGGEVCIGQGIKRVQKAFAHLPLGEDFYPDGSDFDRLLTPEDVLPLGDHQITVMSTPGHTNDGLTYVVGDYAAVGDTIFHPELGSARCDFPGGNAELLYQSIVDILSLPENTILCLGHDYPKGRSTEPCITVAEQKLRNVHCKDPFDRDAYVKMRQVRDAQLADPKLLRPSLIHNLRAGKRSL